MSSTRHGIRTRHGDIVRRSHGGFDLGIGGSTPAGGGLPGSGSPGSGAPIGGPSVFLPGEQMPAQQIGEAAIGTAAVQDGSITTEKLLLEDEFGATMLTPSGFVGSWEDYFLTGLYNGSFGDNAEAGSAGLGRTADCPYWELMIDSGTGGAFSTSSGSLRMLFTDTSTNLGVLSDKVRVRQGVELAVFIRGVEAVGNTAEVFILAEMYFYDGAGQLIGSSNVGSASFFGDDPEQTVFFGSLAPETIYIAIRLTGEALALSASDDAALDIFEVGIFVFDGAHGDAFRHVGPETGTRFFRDDLGEEFYYSGAGWYSTHLYAMNIPWAKPASIPLTATTNGVDRAIIPVPTGRDDVILADLEVHFHVASGGSALSASHKWTLAVERIDDAGSATTLATYVIDSGASNTWRSEKVTLGVEGDPSTASGSVQLHCSWTKTGTPGNLTEMLAVSYRYIAS